MWRQTVVPLFLTDREGSEPLTRTSIECACDRAHGEVVVDASLH